MCFRPAEVEASGPVIKKCPECGKVIQSMGGLVLKSCPFCKCDFTPYLNGELPIPGEDSATPGAPAAPAAPAAPTAPAAPKPPTA